MTVAVGGESRGQQSSDGAPRRGDARAAGRRPLRGHARRAVGQLPRAPRRALRLRRRGEPPLRHLRGQRGARGRAQRGPDGPRGVRAGQVRRPRPRRSAALAHHSRAQEVAQRVHRPAGLRLGWVVLQLLKVPGLRHRDPGPHRLDGARRGDAGAYRRTPHPTRPSPPLPPPHSPCTNFAPRPTTTAHTPTQQRPRPLERRSRTKASVATALRSA